MPKEADPNERLLDFGSIEDEELRAKDTGAHVVNAEPPEDKKEKREKEAEPTDKRERNPDGTFKGEGEKEPEKADEKGEKEPKKSDHVPLAKYLEEKNQLRADLAQRDITLQQYQRELADLKAKFEAKQEPAKVAEPDFVEDPKAYVDHKLGETLQKIEKFNADSTERVKQTEQTAAQAREQVEIQQFIGRVATHEQVFARENPDYYDALAHVRGIRAYQLKTFQPDITDQQIHQIISQEETNLAVNLAQRGMDPVRTAYELAQRYGYQRKAPTQQKVVQQQPTDKLPPDQTLGGGAGGHVTDDDAPTDAVDLALASLFKKR
jgi:hypothetical protein